MNAPAKSVDTACTIYGLSDPRTGAVRYVGKTNNPSLRLGTHISSRSNARKFDWIQSLLREGVRPVMVVLEVAAQDEGVAAEARWVTKLRSEGADLTNRTEDGGSGRPTTYPPRWLALMAELGGEAGLAEACDVSPSTLRRWAARTVDPGAIVRRHVAALAEEHGIEDPWGG